MMGAVTFLIGLVPTYAAIGVAAPLIMVVLRLIQGFAMGGEWGGAVLMAFEYAPHNQRGFYASFPQIGFALGLCFSTGIITLLSGLLSNEAFLSWGWRCAFLVSILLLGVGLFVRLKLLETPEFSRIRENYHVSKLPIAEVIRDYWWNILLGWLARMGEGAVFTVYTLYMFSYLTAIVHLPRTQVLASVTVAALVLIFTTPLAAAWSDRVGRRAAVRIGHVGQWPRGVSVVLAAAIRQRPARRHRYRDLHRRALGAGYGPEAALFCELFDTRVRYTGVSLVYQIGAIIFLAPIPNPCRAAGRAGRQSAVVLADYILLGCMVSALAALMRRTFAVPALAPAEVTVKAQRQ